MKKFFRSILLIINLVFIALLLLAYLTPHVNPLNFVYTSYLGLVFIYLVFINLFFVLLWVLIPKWYFLLSLAVLIIGGSAINRELPYRFSSSGMDVPGSFKVMSYNVRVFDRYNWSSSPELPKQMTEFFRTESPDIICFQEFGINNRDKAKDEQSINRMLKHWPYKYVQYGSSQRSYVKQGLAIFSKYPIIRQAMIETGSSTHFAIYADVKMKDRVVRVFNFHLQSIRLQNKEGRLGQLLNSSMEQEKVVREVSLISGSLKDAYKRRASQVNKIREYIDASPYPVIICGDFNDTPNSYAYHKIRGDLMDGYVESGSGAGTTYNGGLPFLRIDHVFYEADMSSSDFKRHKVRFSDHYPVSCRLAFP